MFIFQVRGMHVSLKVPNKISFEEIPYGQAVGKIMKCQDLDFQARFDICNQIRRIVQLGLSLGGDRA